MSVLMVLDWGKTPFEDYERVSEALGVHDDADAPDGLIEHVACTDDGGLLVADVWESQEALDRFTRERLAAAVDQAGMPEGHPRVLAVHDLPQTRSGDATLLVLFDLRDVAPETYDAMTSRMDAHVRDDHPAASHVAATDEDGMLVVELWDSPAAYQAFAEQQICPAARQVGLPPARPRSMRVRSRIRGAESLRGSLAQRGRQL